MEKGANTFMALEEKIKKYRFWDKADDFANLFGLIVGAIGFILLAIAAAINVIIPNNETIETISGLYMITYILIIFGDLFFLMTANKIVNKKVAIPYLKWIHLKDNGYQYLHWIIDKGNPRYIKAVYFKIGEGKNYTVETVEFDFEDECDQRDYTSQEKYEALINNGMWQAVHRMAMNAIEDKIRDEKLKKEAEEKEEIEKTLDSYWEV